MKKLSLILTLALMAVAATAWAQNSINVGTESDLRNYLTNQEYDNYTFNLTNNITIPSANGEIEVRYRAIINMNGKTIMAENPTIRIFHVVSQGSLPYMPSLTLTGNGTLSGGSADNGGAIYNEGSLTLQNVTIQGFTATNGGAVYNTGTMTMSGGSITGCTASNQGGGIFNKGTLTISGGSVTGNTAGNAGGIHLENKCTFNLTGGTISENNTVRGTDGNPTGNCGGVNVTGGSTVNMSGGSIADNTAAYDDGGVYIGGSSTFTMSGGSVSGNTATRNNGGFRVNNGGTLNLTGGSVTGNSATNNYGGIWMNGTLKMSGNPIVSGNLKASSTASNVYLPSSNGVGKTITVNGAFSEGANVHVTHADGLDGDGYRDFATGYATYNASTDPATVFHSDNAAYEVGLHVSTGAASLIAATHLYDVPYLNVDETGEHGMATRATCTMMSPFDSDSPLTLNDNYWYVVDQDKTFSERITISGTVNLILTDNTQLTANKGIYVPFGSTLHIWAQSTKIETADHQGFILATANETNCSGIGGMIGGGGAGYLHFHGGIIAATGGKNAAGIYGMIILDEGVYGTNIYGGQVIAQGGEYGAGIGGCYALTCGNIRITGGTVIAQAGDKAAGIGSGYRGLMHFRDSGYTGNPATGQTTEIRITGGNVTAIAVTGAGIGGGEGHDSQLSGYGGYEGDGASVYIDGGTVEAWTKDTFAAGINGEVGSNAIGWGYMGTPTYGNTQADSPLEIYASAKVSATTDANAHSSELPLLAAGAWHNNAWTHYKKIKIEPCDHPEHNDPIQYTNNTEEGNLSVDCPYCYTKEPYTFIDTQNSNNWDYDDNWLGGIKPGAGKNVAIAAPAHIHQTCTAHVGKIDIKQGGSLTVDDGGQLIHSGPVYATVEKHIIGHGGNNNTGWNFIATPIAAGTTVSTANGIENGEHPEEYDLYYYDEPTHYWRNHKAHTIQFLNYGQGYLYASYYAAPLTFEGVLQPGDCDINGTYTYTVHELSHAASGPLTGFNLVGNPFACNATVNRSCYSIQTENGKQVVKASTSTTLGPCEGVMVQVAEGDDEVTFTKVIPATQGAPANLGSLQIALTEANTRGASTGSASMLDYAGRFRLVFAPVSEDADGGDEAFAFVSNGEIITVDACDASLQVIDMTGRMVATHSGHIQCVPTAGMTPGIYVLRLINGDSVRTQKIVVR